MPVLYQNKTDEKPGGCFKRKKVDFIVNPLNYAVRAGLLTLSLTPATGGLKSNKAGAIRLSFLFSSAYKASVERS